MADPVAGETRKRAEGLATRLPPLQVAAARVAATVLQGLHGRRRRGQGESFWQFRRYQHFDEARRIDWRRSARGTGLYVRETEWDAAQSVWIWCDASASMRYRSRRRLEHASDRARVLAVALAILLTEGGERVGLLGSGVSPRGGRAGLERFVATLSGAPWPTRLPPVVRIPRHCSLVLIGDFLEPVQDYREIVRNYVAAGCSGHLLQVLDPAVSGFPFRGRIRFQGSEAEEPHLLRRSEQVRDEYRQRLAEHCGALQELAARTGWSYARHTTDRSADSALLALHGALSGALH
ncbi:MAG: DUF58 domain-containing protein [Alphaproteobacteria bacterium]|nr:DUF58 domain-containing protein [Alphaproteobacteria bacterium]